MTSVFSQSFLFDQEKGITLMIKPSRLMIMIHAGKLLMVIPLSNQAFSLYSVPMESVMGLRSCRAVNLQDIHSTFFDIDF